MRLPLHFYVKIGTTIPKRGRQKYPGISQLPIKRPLSHYAVMVLIDGVHTCNEKEKEIWLKLRTWLVDEINWKSMSLKLICLIRIQTRAPKWTCVKLSTFIRPTRKWSWCDFGFIICHVQGRDYKNLYVLRCFSLPILISHSTRFMYFLCFHPRQLWLNCKPIYSQSCRLTNKYWNCGSRGAENIVSCPATTDPYHDRVGKYTDIY